MQSLIQKIVRKNESAQFAMTDGGEAVITIDREQLIPMVHDIKKQGFHQLIDITAIDELNNKKKDMRFHVVYHFLNLTLNQRIRLKVRLAEEASIASICDFYPNANWYEREVFDMYGVFFDNHPDLRRLLTDYGFLGHPQRKDFPLTGFLEVYYDDDKERVQYQETKLPQDMRLFEFESPWQGTNKQGAMMGIIPNQLMGDEKAMLKTNNNKKLTMKKSPQKTKGKKTKTKKNKR